MFSKEPLTQQTVSTAVVALKRLMQLSNQRVVTRDTDAETQAATQLLQRVTFAHANELLGAWQIVHNEFQPLVIGFTALLRRAGTMAEQELAARQQRQKAEAPPVNEPSPKEELEAEKAASAVIQGEAPQPKTIEVNFDGKAPGDGSLPTT